MAVDINDFLNSKSMLTPGAAGGLTLTITNALGSVFHLPLGYVALGISGLFGILILALTASAPIWQRAVFYVLNSLIIFCVAMGSNATGQALSNAETQRTAVSFVSVAYAQDAPSEATANDVVESVESITKNPGLNADQKLEAITKQLKTALPPDMETNYDKGSQGFFRAWNF